MHKKKSYFKKTLAHRENISLKQKKISRTEKILSAQRKILANCHFVHAVKWAFWAIVRQ